MENIASFYQKNPRNPLSNAFFRCLAIAVGRIQCPCVNSRMLWATRSWQISHKVFATSAKGQPPDQLFCKMVSTASGAFISGFQLPHTFFCYWPEGIRYRWHSLINTSDDI